MEADKKKKIAGAGILGGILLFLLIKRAHGIPEPPPDKANLYGKVTNAQTGKAIQGIEVSFNGYAGVTQSDGYYLIENIIPGAYAVTFQDPLGRYETLVV